MFVENRTASLATDSAIEDIHDAPASARKTTRDAARMQQFGLRFVWVILLGHFGRV
jgi:hypothetical protein